MKQKALVAEFIGTFAVVFIGVGAITANYMLGGKSGLVGIALAYGLAYAAMISATAALSGGHLNPAVTVGLLAARKIDAATAVRYIVAQCLGAMVAMFVLQLSMPSMALAAVSFGTPALGENITPFQGLLTEFILTFFLMFVYYGTLIDQRAPKMGGLFVGLIVIIGFLMSSSISGAAMNPARHFGPAFISWSFDSLWIYWVGPIAGASLAAIIYNLILERQ
jgi:MIP family channel proteins